MSKPQPNLSVAQLVSLFSPTKRVLQLVGLPSYPLTPGTKHHRIQVGRMHGVLFESYEGRLQLNVRCTHDLHYQEGKKVNLQFPFDNLADNDAGLAVLAVNILRSLLVKRLPQLANHRLIIFASQGHKNGFEPSQRYETFANNTYCDLFLERLLLDFRYALLDEPIVLHTVLHPSDARAAEAVRPANSATGVSLPSRAGTATPLFGADHPREERPQPVGGGGEEQ